ncbi:RDD family protein [Mycolicibacterium vaccae]|uniref:RDD family protein n=1 Tax=Mycolicibacterium vaccae TaxID=1810 RepID=UPI003CEA900A
MTVVLEGADPAGDTAEDGRELASWPARAGALAVDVGVPVGVATTMALLALGVAADSWARWVFTAGFALTVLALLLNRLVAPVATGWTLGRALFGIAVYRADDTAVRGSDGANVGVGRLTLRELAHLLDTGSLGLGWLWPLRDRRRRTFADLAARTEVRRVARPRRDMRRLVAAVLIGAAVLCAGAVGLAYGAVYRQEQAVDEARSYLAEHGPRIVEQMLSYGTDSIDDDFARAQELTTDTYRQQLTDQQDAVRRAGAVTNEFWAVASAVLTDPPVTGDRAAMLLALQGQRGNNPQDVKFVTATVRVEFEKIGDQWRVANLTVLKAPQMSQAGQ